VKELRVAHIYTENVKANGLVMEIGQHIKMINYTVCGKVSGMAEEKAVIIKMAKRMVSGLRMVVYMGFLIYCQKEITKTTKKMASGLFGMIIMIRREKKAITKTTREMASGLFGI
jgi:hypothetical protein